MQAQWTVKSDGGSAPLTVTMQVAQVTVTTEGGDQVMLSPDQLEPLADQLNNISEFLTFGED